MADTKPPADWNRAFETLSRKWNEVPFTAKGRIKTADLLQLSDRDLLEHWETARRDITTGPQFAHRGWYHTLYAPGMAGKRVVDIGSGFAVDSITFAQHGAKVTFVDLAPTNLDVLRRLCAIMGLKDVDFLLLERVEDLQRLPMDLDFVMAMGSLHHAPAEVVRPEVLELHKHLRIGGRWLQLAYPRERWLREGSRPFSTWADVTDGGAPWAEWYDLEKLLGLHQPAKFDVVLCQNFHNNDFVWFDLLLRSR